MVHPRHWSLSAALLEFGSKDWSAALWAPSIGVSGENPAAETFELRTEDLVRGVADELDAGECPMEKLSGSGLSAIGVLKSSAVGLTPEIDSGLSCLSSATGGLTPEIDPGGEIASATGLAKVTALPGLEAGGRKLEGLGVAAGVAFCA